MVNTLLNQLRRLFSRKKQIAMPDTLWREVMRQHHFLNFLNDQEQHRLRLLTQQFLKDKQFHGAHELVLTDFMMASIAAQACLPVFRLGLAAYSEWVGVIVYPGDFVVPRQQSDEDGVVHEYDEEVMGEAWEQGPVIVSWQDPNQHSASVNVVIHEFAHKLDMANGGADGWPPLPPEILPDDWAEAFEEAFEHFCLQLDADAPLVMDPYAAESPAEFFAVSAEVFFESPLALKHTYPRVFAMLAGLFGLDPAAPDDANQH